MNIVGHTPCVWAGCRRHLAIMLIILIILIPSIGKPAEMNCGADFKILE